MIIFMMKSHNPYIADAGREDTTVDCLWFLNMELWGIEMIHLDRGPIEDRRWQPLSDIVWIPVFPCSRTFFAELSFLSLLKNQRLMMTCLVSGRWVLFCPSPRSISSPTSTWNHLSNIVKELFLWAFLYHGTFFENCCFSLPFLGVVLGNLSFTF